MSSNDYNKYVVPASADILAGSPSLLEKARFTTMDVNNTPRDILELTLKGDFKPGPDQSPGSIVRVIDTKGDQMELADLTVSYHKDSVGNVHNGYTLVSVYTYGGTLPLQQLTVEVGPPSNAVSTNAQVTLLPE